MKTKRGFRLKRPILNLFLLLGLSSGVAGCGPDMQQAACLVSWSPDGSRAALVPDFMEDDADISGLWVFDCKTATSRQIVKTRNEAVCLHPQWSPYGDEILFAVAEKSGEDATEDDGSLSFSLYVINPDGQALRKVVDSTSTSGDAFLLPNAVGWGPVPDSVLYQQARGDKITAMLLNLKTGAVSAYLPDGADSYYLAPSPDRSRIGALLYDKESEIARVYVADFAQPDWDLAEGLHIRSSQIESLLPMIYWAPDSSRFVIPEAVKSTARETSERGFLRIFDSRSGASYRLCSAKPSSMILWNREGNACVFAEEGEDSLEELYRADLRSGRVSRIMPSGRNHLLSWNQDDGRLYFFRTCGEIDPGSGKGRVSEHRLYSCDAEGTRAVSLGHFFTEHSPSWSLSPAGNRLLAYDDAYAPGFLDLNTGIARQIHLIQ